MRFEKTGKYSYDEIGNITISAELIHRNLEFIIIEKFYKKPWEPMGFNEATSILNDEQIKQTTSFILQHPIITVYDDEMFSRFIKIIRTCHDRNFTYPNDHLYMREENSLARAELWPLEALLLMKRPGREYFDTMKLHRALNGKN